MSNKKLVVRPMCTAECQGIKLALAHYLAPGREEKTASCFFYIEGADENIIVDTGQSPELAGVVYKDLGVIGKAVASPEDLLKKVGLKCEDIDTVIFTHLHQDHTANAKRFTRAKFIVQSAELTEALHPGAGSLWYWPEDYIARKFVTVTGDQEISDGIKVMATPGHTAGSQTILVETEKGVVAIAGMCSVMENFYPPEQVKPFFFGGVVPPGIQYNQREIVQSMINIKQTADIVMPLHDSKWLTTDRIP